MHKHFPILTSATVGRDGIPLIEGVNLEAQPGRTTRLVGKNGVGKTTLLHSILGFLPLLDGERSAALGKPGSAHHQRQFGYMPSAVPRLPSLTVPQWLDALSAGFSVERSTVQDKWDSLGGRTLPSTLMGQLSSGNLRKALFVGACAIDRELLILDEPFDEVDIEGQQRMAEIIEAQRTAGAFTLIVSHRAVDHLITIDQTLEITHGSLRTLS
ncbi:MAG TPA: ATP-binding cassette domain-containing protein [Candidatus Corynebacterium gallistercoris]|uniref:ATP-binding cassette domain-containing protein n=1 Tax=Candidatus Corynebacterium gallistercoris TaxID=2838530 RepID=A0A9D1S1T8_9CORY|nr:ATP-binding cassette domain-containing protein [Candidatus Corynebacterium gallistercoris]